MFDRAATDAICKALPGATESYPPDLVSWKVGGKMFACFGGNQSGNGVSVKTRSVETAEMLIAANAAIKAPYFHGSWVRLPFGQTSEDDAKPLIETSYDLIRAALPKAARADLPARETT